MSAIFLTASGQTLELPADLAWVDEYAWSPVVADTGYTLTGALVVETATRQAGRPITLQGDDNRAWLTRAALAQLIEWRDTPGLILTLTLRGTPRRVLFRHGDSPVIEADPVLFYGDPLDTDPYRATLKLLEVQ